MDSVIDPHGSKLVSEAMDAFNAGLTFDDYVTTLRVHQAAFREHYTRFSRLVNEVQSDPPLAGVRTLAIVEDWCPDCVFNVPILARLAEASDPASLRIVRRGEFKSLADRF